MVEKVYTVVSGQSDTESCEDEPMPTVDEQAVQSIMEQDQDESPYNNTPEASPSRSPVKSYKIVNGKLVKNDQKSSSKQVSYGSKYSSVKSEPVPKKNCFVLKEGECTRTCATVIYYSKTDAAAIDSSFGEETKENDIPADEPDDQISVEDMDLTHIKIEPVAEQSEFVAHSYDNICNMEYNDQGEVEYYIQNNDMVLQQEELMLVEASNDGLIETELVMFEPEFVEEVGANIELSTEEMAPLYTETISCDICDELFEDRKELMRHIQTMHIG